MLLEDQTEARVLEEKLLHSERLASIGQLAAGVAHEIGNPVTGIECLAQELEALSGDSGVCQSAGLIREQTRRITQIIHSLMSYAHSGQKQVNQTTIQPVNIHNCVQEAINLLRLSHKNSQIEFQNLCPESHQVSGYEQKLQQVFLNLLKNAAEASQHQGVITVSSHGVSSRVRIHVDDQGMVYLNICRIGYLNHFLPPGRLAGALDWGCQFAGILLLSTLVQ